MISFSRSGSNTLAASESEPSEARGQPSFFCTLANSLACCKPRSEVTIGLNKIEQDQHAILVVVQFAVAGPVACAAVVVQPLQAAERACRNTSAR